MTRSALGLMILIPLWLCLPAPAIGASGTGALLPPASAVLERIAFGSCADEELPQPIWNRIAAARPDLFLFIGDNVYADSRADGPLPEASVAEIARSYQRLALIPEYAAFRSQTPMLAIWDDHDYGINDAGAELPVKQESKALFMDFFGMGPDHPARGREGLYHAETYGPPGRRVQIILLDTRWFRSPLKPTDMRDSPGRERYLPDPDPEKTMLGDAQWSWLARMLEEPADLRLIISSVQLIADGHGWEGWRTLPLERQRFYDLLRIKAAQSVVLLSGDRHVGGFYVRKDITGYPLIELTSSSLNRSFRKERVTEADPISSETCTARRISVWSRSTGSGGCSRSSSAMPQVSRCAASLSRSTA